MLLTTDPTSSPEAPAKATPTTEHSSPGVVACFILPSKHADTLMSLLREFLSRRDVTGPADDSRSTVSQENPDLVWLSHPEAAKCLGISAATLYRYAEQEQIECRKIGNRLQYRLSTIEEFKDQHVRPAKRHLHRGAIISVAPTSGK